MKPKTLAASKPNSGRFIRRMKQWMAAPMAMALVIFALGCERHSSVSTAKYENDDETSGKVRSALKDDTAYKFPDVKVTTFQGTVQLSGFVDNNSQKQRATEIAKNTAGVKDVENNISLK
jgi:osmotically-inducible protein OsmY